jgi:sensor histidine kinase regulating citrate/malate metabolism
MADSQNTHIKWLIELPYTLPIKESDFITIFGNLVENALIAVSEIPDDNRVIHVNAKMLSDEMLGLTVKNPYEGTIKLNKKGLPKSDRPDHGIGLTSVKAVVNRYNGALDISTDDSLFTVGVLLYTKAENV